MALWACNECGTAYAVGLPWCPYCHSTDHEEDGVPKITTWGGASPEGDLERAARAAAAEAATEPAAAAADPASPRTGDDLPVNKDGSASRSQMTDEEKVILDARPAADPEPPVASPSGPPKKATGG